MIRDRRTPLVSSIIIFRDAERFLEESIRSVLAQTYRPWELILVDDGSRDASTGIARRWALSDPKRVTYVDHDDHAHRGVATSRNLGLHLCRGDYVAFLDSDDIWLPQKLEIQVEALRSMPEVGMVYGRTLFWYGWTGRPADAERDYSSLIYGEPGRIYPPKTLLGDLIRRRGWGPAICSVLLRREAVERAGGFEEVFETLYEDGTFWAKVYATSSVGVLDGVLEMYRQHDDSTSAKAAADGRYHDWLPNPAHFAFLNWLTAYLDREGLCDSHLRAALEREFWPYRHRWLHRAERAAAPIARRWLPVRHRRWLRERLEAR